tara:strand:+ start:1914 stop:3119 length:1206 start_codon:yes stop_codon:yes gene_type:complete
MEKEVRPNAPAIIFNLISNLPKPDEIANTSIQERGKSMEFRIEREKILGLVEHVEGVVERRNTIPILSNVLIQVEGDSVAVTATDLDITIRDRITGIDVGAAGKTTVGAATFSALIRKMPASSLIDMKVEEGRMTIRSGRIRYQIPVLPADDFPLAQPTQGEDIEFSITDMVGAFKLIRDSMSTEETRYYLNGAFLAIEDKDLVAVSTDGHRLGIAKIADVGMDAPNAIVPRKAVNQFIKIMPSFEGQVTVRIDQRSIEFEAGDLLFRSKLIDGTFPDYARVIPSGNDVVIKVDPVILQQAIERVSIVTTEKTSAVTLSVEKDKITIIATSPDTGSAQEEVPAESTKEIRVGYNSNYLKDILSNYSECDMVTISLGNETSPALIRPDNSTVNRSVLMPMRI